MDLYLVTGGAGFIGSNVVGGLLSSGKKVRVLDNLSTGKKENILPYLNEIDFIQGDLREKADVNAALEGVDYVLHLGAIPSVARSIENPEATVSVNITGTTILLKAAVEKGVKRVVFASSSSVYGDTPTLPKVEVMPTNPLSPYALSKLAGEILCENFYRLFGLETIALRYFNVFGPRQDPLSEYSAVIPRFVTALLEKRKPQIYGDGLQSRDFTPVQNVVNATIGACSAPEKALGTAYNIGCGSRYTLLDILDILGEILQTTPDPVFKDRRPGDVMHSLADISKAENGFGYNPAVSLKEGLMAAVEWYNGASE